MPSQARDENKPKPGQGYPVFRSQKASLFGGPRLPKSSQNRESDFLKMSVSPRRRAHFQGEGLAKPGQRGVAKPGQAKEGQSRRMGEAAARPKGGQREAKGRPKEAKARPREAKGRPREAKGRPRVPIGRPKGGQADAKERPGEAKGGQARPEPKTGPNQARAIRFFGHKKTPFLEAPGSENPAKIEKPIS